jgi:hypothetical protein
MACFIPQALAVTNAIRSIHRLCNKAVAIGQAGSLVRVPLRPTTDLFGPNAVVGG